LPRKRGTSYEDIERFIIEAGSPVTAARYVDAIVNFCLRLQTFLSAASRAMICYLACA
jgi:hypothetical protein